MHNTEIINKNIIYTLKFLSFLVPLLLRQQLLLHLLKRTKHIAKRLIRALAAIANVHLFNGSRLLPPRRQQVVKRLALAPLQRPQRLVRAAERTRRAADVELVDAVGAAQHLAQHLRNGRVKRAAAHEVDAARLRGETLAGAVDELLRAKPHRQRLRLDNGARVRLFGPRLWVLGLAAEVAAVCGVACVPPGSRPDVGHRLAQVKVQPELGAAVLVLLGVLLDVERRRVEDGLVERLPARAVGFVGLGQRVADALARQAAVFVAQHEHVVAVGGRVVEEVVAAVGLVGGRVHEEGGGRAEGDNGVEGPQGQSEDRGRVVAGKGEDLARGVEAVPVDKVAGYGAETLATVHAGLAELGAQVGGGAVLAARGEGEQRLAVLLVGHVPEVHAADVADVEGCDAAEHEGGEPRGDEGDAGRLGVDLGFVLAEAHDLCACESLY